MCSKTHIAGRSAFTTWRVSSPRSVSETISPGWTSRISSAPMMSKAQLSEATTKRSSSRPSESGRIPCGSRKATIARLVITTVE